LNLGEEDRIGADLSKRDDVFHSPGRIQAIDPHNHLSMAEGSGLDGFRDHLAGGFLGLRRDGIFQVQDQAIRRHGPGLFQGAGIAARQIEDRPARPDLGAT